MLQFVLVLVCTIRFFLHPYNGKIVWIVSYPIKVGDWLTREERKKEIPNVLCCCKCEACTGNWKPVIALAITSTYVMRRSSEQGIEAYKEYCDEMSNSLVGQYDQKLWYTIGQFRWNLYSIGRATFWNQIPPMDMQNLFF